MRQYFGSGTSDGLWIQRCDNGPTDLANQRHATQRCAGELDWLVTQILLPCLRPFLRLTLSDYRSLEVILTITSVKSSSRFSIDNTLYVIQVTVLIMPECREPAKVNDFISSEDKPFHRRRNLIRLLRNSNGRPYFADIPIEHSMSCVSHC